MIYPICARWKKTYGSLEISNLPCADPRERRHCREHRGVRPSGSDTKLIYSARHVSWADGVKGKRCADSPPPCGEGLGVGGIPTFDVLQSPPPCPSPTRGEGTLRHAPFRHQGSAQPVIG